MYNLFLSVKNYNDVNLDNHGCYSRFFSMVSISLRWLIACPCDAAAFSSKKLDSNAPPAPPPAANPTTSNREIIPPDNTIADNTMLKVNIDAAIAPTIPSDPVNTFLIFAASIFSSDTCFNKPSILLKSSSINLLPSNKLMASS